MVLLKRTCSSPVHAHAGRTPVIKADGRNTRVNDLFFYPPLNSRPLDARETPMQFRLLPALLVFLGSYFPLSLILALQDITSESWRFGLCMNFKNCTFPAMSHPILSLLGIVVTGLCLFLTTQLLKKLRYKYPVIITELKPIPAELISYSFPYIVSFMGVDYGSTGKIAGLVTFLAWLFLITYRAGQIIMNPILLVLGWNLYEAKAKINGHDRIIKLLSKGATIPGTYQCQEVQGSYISEGSHSE